MQTENRRPNANDIRDTIYQMEENTPAEALYLADQLREIVEEFIDDIQAIGNSTIKAINTSEWREPNDDEYVAILFRDGNVAGGKLLAVDEDAPKDDLSLIYSSNIVVSRSEIRKIAFCDGEQDMEVQRDGMLRGRSL